MTHTNNRFTVKNELDLFRANQELQKHLEELATAKTERAAQYNNEIITEIEDAIFEYKESQKQEEVAQGAEGSAFPIDYNFFGTK